MKRLIVYLVTFFFAGQALAAEQGVFDRSGKYNVVVAVLAIIFVGLVIYMVRLDLKLRKLEEKE